MNRSTITWFPVETQNGQVECEPHEDVTDAMMITRLQVQSSC